MTAKMCFCDVRPSEGGASGHCVEYSDEHVEKINGSIGVHGRSEVGK